MHLKQGVALTGRNRTGPPVSVGHRQRYRQWQTTTDGTAIAYSERERKFTSANKTVIRGLYDGR